MSLLISWDRLTDISRGCNKDLDIDDLDEVGVKFYEGGMEDVLREVAAYHLKSSKDDRPSSKDTVRMHKHVERLEKLLNHSLNEKQQALFRDYRDAFYDLVAFEAGDDYIYGFLDSYMFFKKSRYGK